MSIIKFWKSAFCFAWMPLYIGGSSESEANTSTSTTNHNFVTTEDRRVVASDAAVAVSGNGNVTSRTESTSFTDSSDRSTSFSDSSNRSTNFSDSSMRESGNTTHITTTDFGSVGKALDSITTMGRQALDVADGSIAGAVKTLMQQSDNNASAAVQAFKLAESAATRSAAVSKDVLSFASGAIDDASAAFARAKEGPDTNKTVMYAALAAIGIVGVMAFAKR